MAARDLTTIDNVKASIGITDANSDPLLIRLVTAMSGAFVKEIDREILRTNHDETFDGNDERILMRPVPTAWLGPGLGFAINLQGPIIGDPVVTIDGDVVPKRPNLNASGWVLLFGYRLEFVDFQFTASIGNVHITYEAGEFVTEPATVPATPFTVQASQSMGKFLSDVGVTYASTAVALTKVASGPTIGQYSVSAAGLYTFAAADTGAAVLIAYAYLPSDVEDAVIEMVAFKAGRRTRLDQLSANLGGQTVSFSRDAWPATVQQVIDRWRRIPI